MTIVLVYTLFDKNKSVPTNPINVRDIHPVRLFFYDTGIQLV